MKAIMSWILWKFSPLFTSLISGSCLAPNHRRGSSLQSQPGSSGIGKIKFTCIRQSHRYHRYQVKPATTSLSTGNSMQRQWRWNQSEVWNGSCREVDVSKQTLTRQSSRILMKLELGWLLGTLEVRSWPLSPRESQTHPLLLCWSCWQQSALSC